MDSEQDLIKQRVERNNMSIEYTRCRAMQQNEAAKKLGAGRVESTVLSACMTGNSIEASRLLERGAKFDSKCAQGFTPLHHACLQSQTALAVLLADRGADLEATNRGLLTPLHCAAKSNSLPTCMKLIMKGANIWAVDSRGLSVFHHFYKSNSEVSMTLECLKAKEPSIKAMKRARLMYVAGREKVAPCCTRCAKYMRELPKRGQLTPCRCKKVRYCSPECKAADWIFDQSTECYRPDVK